MPDRFLVDEELRAGLADAGVRDAGDLLALAAPADAHRIGTFVALDLPGTTGRFYLKRYAYPGWRKSLGLVTRGTLCGRAPEINEFLALQRLRDHEIPAVRPVAAASRSRWGRLVAHALLTEAVPGVVDLDTRLHTPGDPLRRSRLARIRVACDLGDVLARLRAFCFVHGDFHARNVLVRMTGDEPRIWLSDCRRAATRGRGPWYDAACLDRDLRGVMTRGERRRALGSFVAPGDAKEAVGRIAAVRDRLRGPRRAPRPG